LNRNSRSAIDELAWMAGVGPAVHADEDESGVPSEADAAFAVSLKEAIEFLRPTGSRISQDYMSQINSIADEVFDHCFGSTSPWLCESTSEGLKLCWSSTKAHRLGLPVNGRR